MQRRDQGLVRAHHYNDRGECLYERPGENLPKKGAWRRSTGLPLRVSVNRAEGLQCET